MFDSMEAKDIIPIIISSFSLLVSIVSSVVNYRNYAKSKPSLKIIVQEKKYITKSESFFYCEPHGFFSCIRIRICNSTTTPITIDGLSLSYSSFGTNKHGVGATNAEKIKERYGEFEITDTSFTTKNSSSWTHPDYRRITDNNFLKFPHKLDSYDIIDGYALFPTIRTNNLYVNKYSKGKLFIHAADGKIFRKKVTLARCFDLKFL